MNHQPNGNAITQAKKSQQKSKHAQFSSSRSHSSSGFQSFFRWFKKDEKSRAVSDINYPRDVTSSTDTLEERREKRFARSAKGRRKLRAFDSNDTLSPPESPRFSRNFSQSSSCDSVFSTASSFAYVPPVKYLSNRNQKQPEPDCSYTETYQRRVKGREESRESDKRSEATLRRKYQLYPESSDAETNSIRPYILSNRYQDLSLPSGRKINLPDSAKLHDLSVTNHRRTSSDSAKDKQAGAYVHVKGKRKAPAPPPIRINPRTLSPKSSLGRKKRPAPKPPTDQEFEAAAASSTSLLEDREIKALIEGRPSQNFSTSSIPLDMERRPYVSPYLKIREDRKLTDEQKRNLLDQVSKNVRKNDERLSTESPHSTKRSTPDIFTIERGQLVYQGSESPKLPPKEEKVAAPSSPISPRPWFKRQPASNQKEAGSPAHLKSLEKRKSKPDEPENGYSRNSFFSNRFNIFSRNSEDSKKKEREEKRKSQIGIPNISELDREAAEIIYEVNRSNMKINASELLMLRSQINSLKEKANDEENRPKSAKDLISKFEADTTQVNRITLNPAYIGRREFFGEMTSKSEETSLRIEEKPAAKSKLPLLVKEANGVRKNNDLMSLWTCPYCTLQNPNWKIICEACEKIKPYEKRFCANGELIRSNGSPPKAPRRESSENVLEKKTEAALKYFYPAPTNALAKSASESTVGKPFKRQSPSPGRVSGSPQMNAKRNVQENKNAIIEDIEEEIAEVKAPQPLANTRPSLFSPPMSSKVIKLDSPNLNEIRSARLAKFNLMSNKNRFDGDKSNILNTNRGQSPEKNFPDKLDFSDPVALELEKERLRDKIRAMNAKALNDKYPVLKKLPEKPTKQTPTPTPVVPTAPLPSPLNTADPPKLGAIRKTFKNPLEARRESASDEKILNQERVDDIEKREKVSISVQTKVEPRKPFKKSDESIFLPTTVVELDEKALKKDLELTTKQQEEVEVISDQLKSKDGIETFMATLRSKSINKTNTLAINKILRNLENAIADGKYDDAGQLAIDLAKMKVSLSVTRQKDRPKSDIDFDLKSATVNVTMKEGAKDTKRVLSGMSTVLKIAELKQQIEKIFKIPANSQKLMINDMFANKDDKSLEEFNINHDTFDVVVYKEIVNPKTSVKSNVFNFTTQQDSESDDETQNERVGSVEGAVGGDINLNLKMKIDEDGWECPLCTLINQPNRPGCLACSTTRPVSYKVPTHFQEIEYKLKVNEDLRTFFDMDNVQLRQPTLKNDLNRQSANRKSSDIFNILVDEKKKVNPTESATLEQSATPAISSPNITKNKYRGVDNFNPNTSYVFPKLVEVRKPVITSVIYKSSPASAKETFKLKQNHYDELVSLDLADLASNVEKFDCSICFMEIPPRAGAVLRECLHSFCRECLASHIKYSDEAEIKCPYIDDQYSCLSLLQEREIRSLVSKEEYDKHLARSIRQAENKIENTFHCKTPNCRGWCIFEDTSSNDFRCPVCTIVNCLTCGAVHDGLNCKQYQDQLSNDGDSESARQTKQLLQELIDKEEALNCPTCQIFLLKKWGCDWLKCSFCKTEICWVTRGKRWGPNGKGDTSSGCKCGVGGKKCSPKCNYCH